MLIYCYIYCTIKSQINIYKVVAMNKIVNEIREHKNTILNNNEIIIELLSNMIEEDRVKNNYVLSTIREQNRLLKIIIKQLKEKMTRGEN